MARAKTNGSGVQSTANIGFEAKLWLPADKLRNNMDAAESSGRECSGKDQSHGETHPEQVWLPTGLAGRGREDRARAGGVVVRRLGGVRLIEPAMRTRGFPWRSYGRLLVNLCRVCVWPP